MDVTFFDYIGVADMERIHSSTIAWIVSDSCKALSVASRTKILNTLFGTEKNNIKSIETTTEFKHIDIAFKTIDSEGEQWWFLENKIKATLGENQLDKYMKEIEEDTKKDHTKQNANCAILSLLGVFPQDKTGNWYLANYRQLKDILKDVCKDSTEANYDQLVIIKEYIKCVTNLEEALSEFITNPNKYTRVFSDGDKTKAKKSSQKEDDKIMSYISKNSLETLFQKLFFTNILASIKPKNIIDFNRCHVGETRGNAYFGFVLGECEKDQKYSFDISFQKGAFKFSVCKEHYPRIQGKTKGEISIWEKVFNKLKEDNSFSNYTNINKPKSKARMSISYNIGSNWYEKKNIKEFSDIVVQQILIAKQMVEKATEYRGCIEAKNQ
ncbi:MAG: PD-(D/E)XK nuclease family protein [Muribaculaceae bacterium]|nr:PD-(D/E)XK nuclease family protein [Muribaculaceae bacterium]